MSWTIRPRPRYCCFVLFAALGAGCGRRAEPPGTTSTAAAPPTHVVAAPAASPLIQPPTDADVPYVEGSIQLPAQGTFDLAVEYRGRTTQGQPEGNSVGTTVAVGGQHVDVGIGKSRASRLGYDPASGCAYRHVRLSPGRYLFFLMSGDFEKKELLDWRWADVGKQTKRRLDFTVDPQDVGTLDVAVPGGPNGEAVYLAPLDRDGKVLPLPPRKDEAWSLLKFTKAGRARFEKMRPGSYVARAGTARAVATVKAGETGTVTLSDKSTETPDLHAIVPPPTEADAPLIEGLVRLPAQGSFYVSVECVGKTAKGEVVSRFTGGRSMQAGHGSGAMTAGFGKAVSSRLGSEDAGVAYQFPRLAPGRYLVYLSEKERMLDWRWAEVAEGAKRRLDLTIDLRDVGSLEAVLPGGAKDENILLTPLDRDGKVPAPLLTEAKGLSAGVSAPTKEGRARFERLCSGSYLARAGTLQAVAVVRAGETKTVTLAPAK